MSGRDDYSGLRHAFGKMNLNTSSGSGNSDKNKPCFNFAKGACRFGARCKFSHDKKIDSASIPSWATTPSASSDRGRGGGGRGARGGGSSHGGRNTGPQAEISRMLRALSLTPTEYERLLELLLTALDAGDPAVTQGIIKTLAEEAGLQHIRFLLECSYVLDRQPGLRCMGFWTHLVPFLKVLTHDEARSSLVLESSVGTIFNVIYGPSASRSIPFFTQVSVGLKSMARSSGSTDKTEKDIVGAVRVAAAALYMTLDLNQSASIQPQFKDIAAVFLQIFKALPAPQDETVYERQRAATELNRIQNKLSLGEQIQEIERPTITTTVSETTYHGAVDHPGERSKLGPRHDNDKWRIQDISILPTAGELFTKDARDEYLPVRDPNAPSHHMCPGQLRLVDAQFRMLREDTTGPLRDAVRLVMKAWEDRTSPPAPLSRGDAQVPTMIYTGVSILGFDFEDKAGLSIDVKFDQPKSVRNKLATVKERQSWWTSAKYLQPGSLVCMITAKEECFFLIVERRTVLARPANDPDLAERSKDYWRTEKYGFADLATMPEYAMINLRLVDTSMYHYALVQSYLNYERSRNRRDGNPVPQQFIIEFPGCLLGSFEPILRCLQGLMTANIPFTNLLAPSPRGVDKFPADKTDSKLVEVQPPQYMLRRNATIDLLSLASPEHKRAALGHLQHSVTTPVTFEALQKYTTLDKGQCHALIGGLTKELALIQGPPGTGKSYVGTKLVKVLLENREKLDIGPIVCVCYTNHALDQFLVDLLKDGAKQIVRLGSRSKAPELQELTLRKLSQQFESTKYERSEVWQIRQTMDENRSSVTLDTLPKLDELTTAKALRDYLADEQPAHCRQLFGSQDLADEDGFTAVQAQKHSLTQALGRWLRMIHLPQPQGTSLSTDVRSSEVLKNVHDLRTLNRRERYRLLHHWEHQMSTPVLRQLKQEVQEFEASKKSLKQVWNERDKRCLDEAHVIGVTTSSLASHAELLRGLKARVLVCEEAGEVLEAHSLVALLPKVEHCILIGDHQQLRPHIANWITLSLESAQGKKYRLDESLFERLTTERYKGVRGETLRFPLFTLDTQRRMHPRIASLVRETLYPNLIDHENTSKHPRVKGIKRRLFWLDHEHLEGNTDKADPNDTSKTNAFEVEMTAALVQHLFRQGHYKSDRIAVLTPYLGQMKKLKNRLGRMFEILIGDKDQDDLDAEELEADVTTIVGAANTKAPGTIVKSQQDVTRKGTLLSELRLATVDNFQGEEADIIIISLVRSNTKRNVGFLNSPNRINVLLSRARHGMYIIGNADTASKISMWSDVITLLKRGGNFGPALSLRCERHPDKSLKVSMPEDFLLKAPEGGCDERCGLRLADCGHTCMKKCHSDMLHKAEICQQDCMRALKGCSHSCATICGKPCGLCLVKIPSVELPCGHIARDVPCHQAQRPETYRCIKAVTRTLPHCGHELSVACYVDVTSDLFTCPKECGEALPCGHQCKGRCCKNRKVEHPKCGRVCERPYNACAHSCPKICHAQAGDDCGLCEQPCDNQCAHSRCALKCREPCTPCAELCVLRCPHRGQCKMPCAVPCDILPCALRCTATFSACGHQCPGLCGEACPDARFCQKCSSDDIKSSVVDFIMMEAYKNINLDEEPMIFLSCGHFFTAASIDGQVSFNSVYELAADGTVVRPKPLSDWVTDIKPNELRCPTCRRSISSISRYTRITKAIQMQELAKRFIASAMARWGEFETTLAACEQMFHDHPPTPTSVPSSAAGSARYEQISDLLTKIYQFEKSIAQEEEPFAKIRAMVVDAIKRQRVALDENNAVVISDDTTVAMTQRALASSLYLRAAWAYAADLFKLNEKCRFGLEGFDGQLQKFKRKARRFIRDASEARPPLTKYEVEARIFHAKFVGVEIQLLPARPRVITTLPLTTDTPLPDTKRAELLTAENLSLDIAETLCNRQLSLAKLKTSIEETRKMLRGGTFMSPVTSEEQRQVFEAMKRELGGSGTGHWYYCANRHLFTIGECGMPMQLARCPQCDAPIGGQHHQAVGGVTRATDFEDQIAGHHNREGLLGRIRGMFV